MTCLASTKEQVQCSSYGDMLGGVSELVLIVERARICASMALSDGLLSCHISRRSENMLHICGTELANNFHYSMDVQSPAGTRSISAVPGAMLYP